MLFEKLSALVSPSYTPIYVSNLYLMYSELVLGKLKDDHKDQLARLERSNVEIDQCEKNFWSAQLTLAHQQKTCWKRENFCNKLIKKTKQFKKIHLICSFNFYDFSCFYKIFFNTVFFHIYPRVSSLYIVDFGCKR